MIKISASVGKIHPAIQSQYDVARPVSAQSRFSKYKRSVKRAIKYLKELFLKNNSWWRCYEQYKHCYYGFLANRVRSKLLPTVYDLLDQPERKAIPIRFPAMMKNSFVVDPLEAR